MAAPRVRVPALRVSTPGPCAGSDPASDPCGPREVPATPRASPASLAAALLPCAAAAAVTAAQWRFASPPGGAPLVADPFFGEGVSLTLPLVTTALYLAFCTLGPRVMAARKPLSCKAAMMVYNCYQAAFNAACVAVLLRDVRAAGCSVWGNVPPPGWRQDARFGRVGAIVWLHYNNKYIELLDSVFMVLRKKTEQLSFLHCYHHCLLIWAWLLVLRLGGCIDGYFGVACNATIHVLMYSYYALASAGVRCPWKRHLTMAQMVQFCACAGQSLYLLANPGCCPRALPVTQLWVMSNMLVLFGRFYVKQYSGKAAQGRKDALLAAPRAAAPAAAATPPRTRRRAD